MSTHGRYLLAGTLALAVTTPAAAETWARFSASDRTAYLVDVDTLTAVDGVVTARMARVPLSVEGADLSHDTEEVLIRCSDGQSRSGATVSYGPDGAETDRYTEDGGWGPSTGGVYGTLKTFACDDMRPSGSSFPTVRAFIEGGRGR